MPLQTRMISSSRLCRRTGTSISTSGSRSRNWWRLRKMNTPTTTKATTAIVNATRNAGTAPSITVGNQVTWSLTNALISIPNLYSEPIFSLLADYNDVIGRVRFDRVRSRRSPRDYAAPRLPQSPEPILRVLQVSDPDVCLLASQYSLIDHKNALNNVFPAARQKNVSFVIGSSLNAGFISGSSRYNYGKDFYKIPAGYIDKRKQLREVAGNHGVDLRNAALQFSAAPDVPAALIVGVSREHQILEDYTSMQTKIPAEFWADLKSQNLIEHNAPIPV
jgi:Aldo/keto reductase family